MRTLRVAAIALAGVVSLLALLVAMPAGTAVAQEEPPSTVTLENDFRITFRGVTNNANGTSTWRYYVEELAGAQDLSNWVLALPNCTSVVAANPEPWETVNPDPNAQLHGIKWETGAGFQQGEFAVTLSGQWAIGATQVAAKGPDVEHGTIAGPICQPAGQQAILKLNKSVSAGTAVAGDVVTYTIQLRNEGTAVAQGVVITDPLPVGVTFVDGSLGFSGGTGEYVGADRLVRWQGDLPAGQTATLTFRASVDGNVGAGTPITNRAYAQGQVATATTTVGEANAAPAWTILVYLAADNNLGTLSELTVRDLVAFQALEQAVALNPKLQISVQWDRSPLHANSQPDDTTRRYRVRPDQNPFALAGYTEGVDTWDLGELNMGDAQTLYDFVNWGRDQAGNSRVALVVIGHGGGWSPDLAPALGYNVYLPSGIAWDDSSGDYLSTKELGQALFWATEQHTNPLDVIYFEASMMATIEVAYEIRDAASYLVASQGAVWARFAYDQYMSGVDENTDARELATAIVAGYADSLPGYPLTMGAIAIQASALTPLVNATNDLAVALTTSLGSTRSYVSQAYTASQKFDSNWDLAIAPPDAYVDLYDFASRLQDVVPAGETDVHTAAQAMIGAWSQVVVTETHRSGQPWINPGVTWEYDEAHGLSIYLPLGEDHWLRDYYRSAELAWARDTQWDEFLHSGWYAGVLPPPLPDAVAAGQASEIDPTDRPGLYAVQPGAQNLFFLPLVGK